MKKYRTTLVASMAAITALNVGLAISGHIAGADNPVPAGLINAGPSRVLDTRTLGPVLAPGQTVTVQTGFAGATAVAVNITMTDVRDPGYVTAWASGPVPATSIMNSAGADVANYAVVPVTETGTFQLYNSASTHLLVDVMGYYSTVVPFVPGDGQLAALITGYAPSTVSPITHVSGVATNGTQGGVNMRVDVECPDGTVQTDELYAVPPGAQRGWSVLCANQFTEGAVVQQVVQI